MIIILYLFLLSKASADDSYIDYFDKVPCNEEYIPDNCNYPFTTLEDIVTVEDLERCAPALLPLNTRSYYWGAAGRKMTYKNDILSLRQTYIIPRILRDVSQYHFNTTLLGATVSLPLGIAPTAGHKLAHEEGELATARAAAKHSALMILSSLAQTRLEDVASAAYSANKDSILWMQTYIFKNRNEALQLMRRAKKARYKAIVVTVDTPLHGSLSCNGRDVNIDKYVNLFNDSYSPSKIDDSLTFKDLKWLVDSAQLPVVAKGVTTGSDAIAVARAGVSAVIVSNHGGRQLENARPVIESLREVVNALRRNYPRVEVYMDGGIRNGWDVFKVLAAGAKAAFVGRPALWGLAVDGEKGVYKMLSILKNEFKDALLIAGYANPREIFQENNSNTDGRTTLIPPITWPK